MPISNSLKYTFVINIVCICLFSTVTVCHAQSTADTVVTDTMMVKADTVAKDTVKKELAGHQLMFGVDIFHPILNSLVSDRYGYEVMMDYYLKRELYLECEGGWGGSTVNYTDLKYKTTNNFFRVGINRVLIARERPKDWDMFFIGFQLAAAPIERSASTFTVLDSVWGNAPGSYPAKNMTTYWFELNGGVRVELFKGIFAGWTIRGKFLLNDKQLTQLAPLYIAGYGRGDKSAVFDFNFYISYAVHWKRKGVK